MKKQVLLIAAAIGLTVSATAQDLESKNGHAILPEAGDWGLGFDATPLFNYVGNMFNGSTNNTFNTAFTNSNNAIYGKYYASADMAYRGWLRIGFGSTTDEMFVNDVTSTTTPPAQVTDEVKTSYNNIILGGGVEMRRGHNRLQGYYGGDLLIGLMGTKTEYTYGNTLTDTYTTHTTNGMGTLVDDPGNTFMIGLRGVIGIEYFFLPKISLGAEYSWGLGLTSTGEGTFTSEAYDLTDNTIEESTTTTAGESSFAIDTDINNMMFGGGSVKLLFHF